jgi:pimeloyl-ACP methyl ester carboxylesterase
MTSRPDWLRCEQGGHDLLILLPGAYMKPEGFMAAGFFQKARQRALDLDLAVADLDLEQLAGGAAIPAIGAALEQARRRYRKVWLGGISLGGFLSLSIAAEHPGWVDGLCLLAPYPGSRITTGTITAAGGLAAWQPAAEQLASDPEYRVWHWLRSPPSELPVFVGYGRDDRFAAGMEMLASCFPESSRHVVDGSHDWPAWRALWERFLAGGATQ